MATKQTKAKNADSRAASASRIDSGQLVDTCSGVESSWAVDRDDSPIRMVVGIDPGAEGGIVALSLTKALILACPLPWKAGRGIDLAATCIRLETLRDVARDSDGRCLAIVEKQLYMARDGGKGIFTTGRNFGRLEGLLEAIGMEFVTPEPNKHGRGWQSILGSGEGDTKARARELVAKELPDLELLWGRRTVPHQGLADAGAIALWGLEAVQKGLDILAE